MAGVVVGVSPITGSPAALRWAADEARLRSLPMRAVLAWRPPRVPAAPAGRPPAATLTDVATDPALDAQQRLGRIVDAALGTDAEVSCSVVKGSVVKALLAAAAGADLLVIGEPRPGRLGTMRSTMVAPALVVRATCPVVVIPA